ARRHDVRRALGGVDRDLDGARAIEGRDAGLDSIPRLDRDGERRLMPGAVPERHQRQAELLDPLALQRKTDQPTAVLGHEVHGFGRRHLCRNDEIAFVLAVLVIDKHEHAAAFRLFDQLGGGGFELLETHCAAPGPVWGPSRPRRRATYRATWSISRLTGTPVPFEPRFVTSWV